MNCRILMPNKFSRFRVVACVIFLCLTVFGCLERSDSRSESSVVGQNQEIDAIQPIAVDSLPSLTQTTVHSEAPIPTLDSPVTFAATSDRSTAKPGEILRLIVRGRILSNWHIYSADGPSGVSIPTRFELSLPDGILREGDWKYPDAKIDVSSFGLTSKYVDEFQASVELRLSDSLSAGPIKVGCSVRYQACNLDQCLQPKTILLNVPIQVSNGESE